MTLRESLERVARQMTTTILELRRQGHHHSADEITRLHDEWVRVARWVLDDTEPDAGWEAAQ